MTGSSRQALLGQPRRAGLARKGSMLVSSTKGVGRWVVLRGLRVWEAPELRRAGKALRCSWTVWSQPAHHIGMELSDEAAGQRQRVLAHSVGTCDDLVVDVSEVAHIVDLRHRCASWRRSWEARHDLSITVPSCWRDRLHMPQAAAAAGLPASSQSLELYFGSAIPFCSSSPRSPDGEGSGRSRRMRHTHGHGLRCTGQAGPGRQASGQGNRALPAQGSSRQACAEPLGG